MSAAFAPDRLPLAPKPLRDELLSSWLLRLAAANAISFFELLDGLRWRYPESLDQAQLLDYLVPETTLCALSKFGRAPLAKLRELDLSRRVPQVNSAWLLRFAQSSWLYPRVIPGGFATLSVRGASLNTPSLTSVGTGALLP